MIGEDDGSVAFGNASHGHMEDTMLRLNIMLLQPQRKEHQLDQYYWTDQPKMDEWS